MNNGNPSNVESWRAAALAAWRIADPSAKAEAASALGARAAVLRSGFQAGPDDGHGMAATARSERPASKKAASEAARRATPSVRDDERPGRPARPRTVAPRDLAARPLGTPAGRVALLHAVAHIEFNAIDLALDAAWRFDAMPDAFVLDWLSVAADEARHFRLLADEMARRGAAYGDLDAHDGLWRMADLTRADVLARMALVPGVLEARGLDATPPMQARLQAVGDTRAVAILQVILDDEIGHVAIGRRWFEWLCTQRGLDPRATFAALARRYGAPRPRGPLNIAARQAAGWTDEDIAQWEAWTG